MFISCPSHTKSLLNEVYLHVITTFWYSFFVRIEINVGDKTFIIYQKKPIDKSMAGGNKILINSIKTKQHNKKITKTIKVKLKIKH